MKHVSHNQAHRILTVVREQNTSIVYWRTFAQGTKQNVYNYMEDHGNSENHNHFDRKYMELHLSLVVVIKSEGILVLITDNNHLVMPHSHSKRALRVWKIAGTPRSRKNVSRFRLEFLLAYCEEIA